MPGPLAPPGTPGTEGHGALEGAAPWGRPPRWATYWLPIVFSALVQLLPALARLRPGPEAPLPPWYVPATPAQALISLGLAIVGLAALVFARRFPGPVVAVASVAASLELLFGAPSGPPYLALGFAIVGAIVRGARIWAWASVGACWVATLGAAALLAHEGWTPLRIAGMTAAILIVLGIGELIRTRRERAAELSRLARERRQDEVRAERTRIARELHDVLAHSLSQINVQAGVGLHLMDRQPDKAREALAGIKETSKSALDEVRAVLGVLRAEGVAADAPLVPEPDLSRLPGLVASIAAHGVEVELDDGLAHSSVPKPLQLAVYRIVQESLTNVQRHANGATRARVELRHEGGDVLLEVSDDGRASGTASETGGRGLLGMRERAELLGGRLSAGPAEGGGFRVAARIPLGRAEEGAERIPPSPSPGEES